MIGFNQRVQGLLQLLKEGEREELIAKLDPAMAKKLEERRKKENGMPGKGGIKPQLDKEVGFRPSGMPGPQDVGNAMLESAGRYHLQNNPPEVRYSEGD
jgi:hypothetical protein